MNVGKHGKRFYLQLSRKIFTDKHKGLSTNAKWLCVVLTFREHIQKIQRTNQIATSTKLEGRFNLTIEMETVSTPAPIFLSVFSKFSGCLLHIADNPLSSSSSSNSEVHLPHYKGSHRILFQFLSFQNIVLYYSSPCHHHYALFINF